MSIGMSKGHARVLAVLVFGLFGGAAGAGQEGEDMKLEDMGFIMRPANTPAQVTRLKLLPPRKFVARTANGRRYYIYADPDYCKCAFVGNETAMKNYQNAVPTGAHGRRFRAAVGRVRDDRGNRSQHRAGDPHRRHFRYPGLRGSCR